MTWLWWFAYAIHINPSTQLIPNLNPSPHMAWQIFFTQQYKKWVDTKTMFKLWWTYGNRAQTAPSAQTWLIANRRDLKRPTNTLTSDASLPPPRSLSSTSTIIVWRTCIYSNIFEYFLIQIFVRTLFVSNLRCINISCFKAACQQVIPFFWTFPKVSTVSKKNLQSFHSLHVFTSKPNALSGRLSNVLYKHIRISVCFISSFLYQFIQIFVRTDFSWYKLFEYSFVSEISYSSHYLPNLIILPQQCRVTKTKVTKTTPTKATTMLITKTIGMATATVIETATTKAILL